MREGDSGDQSIRQRQRRAGSRRPAGEFRVGSGSAAVEVEPPRKLARLLGVVLTDRAEVGALSVRALVALGRYPYTD